MENLCSVLNIKKLFPIIFTRKTNEAIQVTVLTLPSLRSA